MIPVGVGQPAGGVAVAGGIATVAYLAHRKHVQR